MRLSVLVFTRALLIALVASTSLHATPTITQQPKDTLAVAGAAASLSVVAGSSGPLSYQWRRDGYALNNATSSFLSIPVASQSDSGTYDVQISDGDGIVTSTPVTFRVAPAVYPTHVTPNVATALRFETPDNGAMRKIAALSDGRFYIAGSFTTVQGQPCAYVARFAADGSLDRTFVPPRFDDFVYSIAVQSDGRPIVAGNFTTVDGVNCPGAARLNIDGSRDATFSGFGTSTIVAPKCTLAAVAPDGSIFVGGSFQFPDRSARLVKLAGTGEIDPSFLIDKLLQEPSSIAFAPDGRIYGVGTTYLLDGVYKNAGVFRLLANGSIDRTFDAGSGGLSNNMAILRQADGHVIVSGYFTNFNNSGLASVVRLDDTGAVDRSFAYSLSSNFHISGMADASSGEIWVTGNLPTGPVVRLTHDGAVDPTFATAVGNFDFGMDLAPLPSGKIVVLSANVNANALGTISRRGAAIFESDGRLNSFDPAFRFPANIALLKLLPGGKLLVGGTFRFCNGAACAPIIRLNGDFTIDATFDATATGLQSITSGAIQPDGNIFVVGSTALVNATTARLASNGAADTSFQKFTLTAGATSVPTVLHDGRILLVDTQATNDGFDVFASNGTRIANHGIASAGTGNGFYTTTAAQLPSGQLLFGGSFLTWAGQNKPKLVRVNPDGQVDATFTVNPVSMSTIVSFDSSGKVLQSTGRLLLGTIGSSSASYPTLSRFKSNGDVDSSFTSGLPALLSLNGYTIEPDDSVLVWGQLSSNFGAPFVVRLLANGSTDSSFGIVGDSASVNRTTLSWTHCLTLDSGDMVATSTDGRLTRYKIVTNPVITTQPVSVKVAAGDPLTLSVTADGPGSLTYQWYLNDVPITGATNATLTLPITLPLHSGSYRVAVTNSNGTTTSDVATVTVDVSSTQTTRLSNLSVRAMVSSSPLIAGFATSGSGRDILIRGVGPGLLPLNVADAAADPKLSLYNGTVLSDENDNWGGDQNLSAVATRVGAFPLSPSSLDAVLLRTVVGSRTVHLRSMNGSGTCLVELYDASTGTDPNARLTNASARYFVGTGGSILIAGITISGSGHKGILVRGVGPGLADLGVQGFLADPQIEVYAGINKIAENNDWGGTFTLSSASAAVGAFPLSNSSHDAALIIYLPAGSYTVQLSGVGGTTGEGLIEVYELP